MNILMIIHRFPPDQNAGAETYALTTAMELIKRGAKVKVFARRDKRRTYKGVEVHSMPMPVNAEQAKGLFKDMKVDVKAEKKKQDDLHNAAKWCDVIFTHLDMTGRAFRIARQYQKPLIHMVHNARGIIEAVRHIVPQGLIYNSETLKKEHQSGIKREPARFSYLSRDRKRLPEIVIPPIVREEDYKVRKRGKQYITLINPNPNKGGFLFRELAKDMPEHGFMAVQGGYGWQCHYEVDGKQVGCVQVGHRDYREQEIEQLPNIKWIPQTGNMGTVYRRTKILLLPSRNESWGRVCSEAMWNGIPVIANPTAGVQEQCGDAIVYADYRNKQEWKKAIAEVLENYDHWSAKALERAKQVNDLSVYDNLFSWLKHHFVKSRVMA